MALALGYIHPEVMLKEMLPEWLEGWVAYNEIEPIGAVRQDLYMAQICSVITNIARSIYAKKGMKPELTKPPDFLFRWNNEEDESDNVFVARTPEQMKRLFMRLAKNSKANQKRIEKK